LGGKKVTKKQKPEIKKVNLVQKTKTNLVQEEIDKEKIAMKLMRREMHYFKGLSIMVTVLIVCIFFAFAALFSAMYMETRMMRVSFDNILLEIQAQNGQLDGFEIMDDISAMEEAVFDWQNFAGYGFTTYYPETWIMQDKPAEKRIDFTYKATDDNANVPEGSYYILHDVGDYALKNKAISTEKITVGGVEGNKYVVKDGDNEKTVVVLPLNGKFVQFHFANYIIDDILSRFEITK